jgi:hypothetical protein
VEKSPKSFLFKKRIVLTVEKSSPKIWPTSLILEKLSKVNRHSLGEISLGKTSLGETSLGETSLGKTSLGETLLGETSLGKTLLGENSVGKTLLGENSLSETSPNLVTLDTALALFSYKESTFFRVFLAL